MVPRMQCPKLYTAATNSRFFRSISTTGGKFTQLTYMWSPADPFLQQKRNSHNSLTCGLQLIHFCNKREIPTTHLYVVSGWRFSNVYSDTGSMAMTCLSETEML